MALDIANIQELLQGSTTWGLVALVALMVWKLVWYGLAIYKTIEKKQKTWFVILFISAFVFGDLGLLAIIYLLLNKNPRKKKTKKK
jgi:hypothetical protein